MGNSSKEEKEKETSSSNHLRHEVFANDKPPTMTGGKKDSNNNNRGGSFVPRRCKTNEELLQIQNIMQLQDWATQNALPSSLSAFVNYGAEDEESIIANREGFTRYYLRPRILKDVSSIDTTTQILQGRVKLSFPVCVAPFAGCRAIHPDGENAVAAAACAADTVYTIPNWASIRLPTILENCQRNKNKNNSNNNPPPPPLFFQVYPHKPTNSNEGIHREHMKALLEYLAATGSGRIVAVVVTVDTANNGNRERTYKNPQWLVDINEQVGGFPMPCALQDANLPAVAEEGHSAKMNWNDIRWMKDECQKHQFALIVKGIMTSEDALLAAKADVDAIIVSNHGGRQLDGTRGTVEVVEECVQALAAQSSSSEEESKMEIYVDGGIRRGKDVVKCLALGAKCVFIGRPVLWGLAAGGQAGVERAFEILRNEYREVLQLIGCQSTLELSRRHIGKQGVEDIQRTTTTPTRSNMWFVATACVSLAAFALGRTSSSSKRN